MDASELFDWAPCAMSTVPGTVSQTALSPAPSWIIGLQFPSSFNWAQCIHKGPSFGIRQAGGQSQPHHLPAQCLSTNALLLTSVCNFLMSKMGIKPAVSQGCKAIGPRECLENDGHPSSSSHPTHLVSPPGDHSRIPNTVHVPTTPSAFRSFWSCRLAVS